MVHGNEGWRGAWREEWKEGIAVSCLIPVSTMVTVQTCSVAVCDLSIGVCCLVCVGECGGAGDMGQYVLVCLCVSVTV